MTDNRFTIKRSVSECCEASSWYYNDGTNRPYNERYKCDNCGNYCKRKTLIYMTHKYVGEGTYRKLPEPMLVSDFLFSGL